MRVFDTKLTLNRLVGWLPKDESERCKFEMTIPSCIVVPMEYKWLSTNKGLSPGDVRCRPEGSRS